MTKARNPRDGLLKAITPSPQGVQRSPPNDSRKGSNSRALTALLESWVNDSRDLSAPPGERNRDAEQAPCSAGEQQSNCTQREWCPVLRVPPAAATGAPGEQKHLPDVNSKKETLYDDFSRPDERKRKEVPMRDLNYDLKQLCRHNRDGSYATQADREHILDLIADQLHEIGFRHMQAHSPKPKHVESWLA